MLYPRVNMLKNTKEIILKNVFAIIPMRAIRHSSGPAGSDLYTTCKRNMTFGKVSGR